MKRTGTSPQAQAVAAADGNPIQAACCPFHPADTPEAELWPLRGSHSATPTKHLPKSLLCCLTKPLPFPPSNLASFVNIS